MPKFMPTLAGLAAAAMLLVAGPANAVIIGFEGVVPPSSSVVPATPYSEAGFTLTNSLAPAPIEGIFGVASGTNNSGSAIFGWCGGCLDGLILTLSADSGAPFSLLSFEAANLNPGAFVPGMAIQVTGNLASGGTVVQTFFLIQDIFTLFTLDPGFVGLSSVEFLGTPFPTDNFAFDNLEVVFTTAAVSEPATLALFGLGLAGFGFMRRKRAA